MKKTIIIALLAGMSSVASASDYSSAVARQEYCSNSGEYARMVYDGRISGKAKQVYFDETAHITAGHDDDDRVNRVIAFSINYGYDKATDGKDAYMKSWAYCMDRMN